MQLKEKKRGRRKFQLNKQKTTAILYLLILSLFIIDYPAFFGLAKQKNKSQLSTNTEIYHDQAFVEGGYYRYLGTTMILEKSIIHVNYTVLATSNTSVHFAYYDNWINIYNTTLWTPEPQNFTLTPGESFADNFTLLLGPVEQLHYFTYRLQVANESLNATVHLWYKYIFKAESIPINLWFTISAICGTMFILIIVRRKKSCLRD